MIPFVVLALVSITAIVVPAVVYDRMLASERARVNDLLTLLQAKAAPAEHAAYVHTFPPEPERTFLTSPDGLVSIEVGDDDV